MIKRFSLLGLLSLCWLLLLTTTSHSQDSLIKAIPISGVSLMTIDPNGNIYAVNSNNTLLRFDRNGKPTGQYNNLQYGNLQSIDASNPLKILLFYPQFSRIILLDNMLSPKTNINLQQ